MSEYTDWMDSQATQDTARGGNCLTPEEIEAEEDQLAAELCQTEPRDLPAPTAMDKLLRQFVSDFKYLTEKTRNLPRYGRSE